MKTANFITIYGCHTLSILHLMTTFPIALPGITVKLNNPPMLLMCQYTLGFKMYREASILPSPRGCYDHAGISVNNHMQVKCSPEDTCKNIITLIPFTC